jgi:hypothetical protein
LLLSFFHYFAHQQKRKLWKGLQQSCLTFPFNAILTNYFLVLFHLFFLLGKCNVAKKSKFHLCVLKKKYFLNGFLTTGNNKPLHRHILHAFERKESSGTDLKMLLISYQLIFLQLILICSLFWFSELQM